MYTTHIIEGFHRQLSKVTKTKSVFPSDQALEKNIVSSKSEYHKEMDSEI
ncbi:hypothetical protein SAMN05660923_00590 [Tepidimicrobium xylanilyticum]|uniref:Transposase, Mutator family n=1 Tax=Tepidimicrobium xylanilyticum TaxID=1123352 RepID=A0A1H2SZA8_9FIRM|nr:hypothetical protein SAMN05660923_00590 [Tepidimicrobium xylanilyticum]